MIEIDGDESNTRPMNPIALIETTGTVRSAVQGALATDPVVPTRSCLNGTPGGLRPLANVAKPCGLDRAGLDQSLLRAGVDRLA